MVRKVSLIGAGKVAWHLGPALEDSGMTVQEVYSRDIKNAEVLAQKLYNASATNSLDFTESEAEVFIILVSDGAIKTVSEQIKLPDTDCILIHTSGAYALSELLKVRTNVGVFYPLQTFSKDKKIDFREASICIDADKESVLDVLGEMAYQLTEQVYHLNDTERRRLHVSAVFACNFTNHCFKVAEELMSESELHFDMLKPLIEETVKKAFSIGAEKGQTGPAIRGDNETMDKHLKELEGKDIYQEIYKIVSKSIQQ